MHDIGQLARNSSPIFAQSGKSSFTLSEILPNVKRVLTVCKSSAGDSGKKARRLIAEAPEMPFHTALISRRGGMFSFSGKGFKKVKGCEFFRLSSKGLYSKGIHARWRFQSIFLKLYLFYDILFLML